MGLSPSEFWSLTPRELAACAKILRQKKAVEELILVNSISALVKKNYKPIFGADDGG